MKDDVISWLKFEISFQFKDQNVFVWLIGSIVTNQNQANDCDVLFIFDKQYINQLIICSDYWRNEFEKQFKSPLHLTRITLEELQDWTYFLKSVSSKPHIQLFPLTNCIEITRFI